LLADDNPSSRPQHLWCPLSPITTPTVDARRAVGIGIKTILETASPRSINTPVIFSVGARPIVARASPWLRIVGRSVLRAADDFHGNAAEVLAGPSLKRGGGDSDRLSSWGWSGEGAEAEAHDCVDSGSLHVWWLCWRTKVSTQKGKWGCLWVVESVEEGNLETLRT
jgi:hypothetical protein